MDPMGLRVTLNAYYSLMTHTKQLLLVTFCDATAGIQASFRTHGRTEDGRTDRRGSRNSYLDWLEIKSKALKQALGSWIELWVLNWVLYFWPRFIIWLESNSQGQNLKFWVRVESLTLHCTTVGGHSRRSLCAEWDSNSRSPDETKNPKRCVITATFLYYIFQIFAIFCVTKMLIEA